MARKPFVIIDAEILNSSIWTESASTRLVWFTLLILCDTDGYVGASLPGLARQAAVSVEDCSLALTLFLEPDPFSRTKEHEGRRVEVADRGWRVLNFSKVLERLSSDRVKARDRMRKMRARKREKELLEDSDGYVTVPTRNRDQGIESREEQKTDLSPEAPTQRPLPMPDTAQAILDEWSRRTGTNLRAKATIDANLKRIRLRLKDGFTAADLLACVTFALRDPFYVDKGYAKDPHVLWKDAGRVEDLIRRNKALAPPPVVVDRRPQPETPWARAKREADEANAAEAAQKALEAAQ
jgi:hypothetical protein